MKTTTNRALVLLLSIFTFSLSAQDTIQGCLFLDFENIEGMNLFEGAEMSDQFEASFGLTFSLEGGGFPVLAEVGGSPPAAFGSAWGNDTPAPQDQALIGDFFLTDDGQLSGLDSPPVVLDFATAIDSFAGCILDMDFGEVFKIEAYGEFGNLILADSIMAGDPDTGDGRATCWGFNLGNCTGMVYQIKFSGYRETAGAFGLGLDNFSFCYAGVNAAVDYTICEGESLIINDEVYTETGNYEQLLFTDQGCDSLVFINLEVLPTYEEDLQPITICEGETIEINGEIFTMAGDFQQTLMTAGGCDSIINFAIAEIEAYEITETYGICDGDSLIVNEEIYTQSATYTQTFQSVDGCDSILTIQLEVYETFLENVEFTICDGQNLIYNGEEYDTAGEYVETFTTIENCDSTVVLTLNVNPTYVIIEDYEICDNEALEINGVVYDTQGVYQQDYLTALGCDSMLIINVDILPTFEISESYTLVDGDQIEINGEIFNVSGEYVQVITASNGCDSLINIEIIVLPPPDPETVIYYDLNNCSAESGYSEFTAAYPEELDCTTIDASIISRPSGFGHSCTPGLNGEQAMCVSSQVSCDYDPESDYMIGFEFIVQPGAGMATVISNFNFYEKAPEQFQWTTGGTGDNNYPTLYGIRILKNNMEIFKDEAISTNRDWTLQTFDFTSNDDFRITSTAVIKVELIPYCTIGNFSTITAWDIDELSINAYCTIASSRLFGQVTSSLDNTALPNVEMRLSTDSNTSQLYTDEKGLYAFDNLIAPYGYNIEAYDNRNVINGVSTLDMIIMQKHILNIQPFENPELFIAADINKSNSVTAIDLIELRKVILGIYDEFPNNTSWRFFNNEDTPLSHWQWNESIAVNEDNFSDINFKGIKIGDLNNSHSITTHSENRSREQTTLNYQLEHINDQTIVHFYASENLEISGMQISLHLESNSLIDIIPGKINLAIANVYQSENQLNISYSEEDVILAKDDKWFSIILDNTISDLELSNSFKNELYKSEDLSRLEILLESKNKEALTTQGLSLFTAAPNPFNNTTQLSFMHNKEEDITMQLIDINGKAVMSKKLKTVIGTNTLSISKEELGLQTGYYIVRINNDTNSISTKLICF